jgi:sugar phosphate isomerase/epimerase
VAAAGPRIELAVDLGVPALRVLCGSPREELSRPALIGRCAEHLREAADLAAQAGVQLWLETHDRASRAADCAAIVRAADHPALGISYDNMHPYRAGEPLEATLAALGSLVGHCHFHDGLADPAHVVIRPLGLGEMPVDDMFHGLLDLGYDGYLSGEWFDDMYGAEPDQALAAYHRDMVGLLRRHGAKLG